MKKRLLAMLMTAAMTIPMLTACGGSNGANGSNANNASRGPVVLRMAQASAADGAIGLSMEEFADMVKEKTNGNVEVQVFHNGQLGTERDNIEAIQLNNLDLAVVNNSVLANFMPWFSVFDLPYVIQSAEHADAVFLGDIGKDMLSEMETIGIHGLSIWESGFRNLTNSVRDVNTVDDVKGLRVRVMENQVHQALWMALGADAVPMAWGDAYTAMQQGAIDGQENPTTVIDKNNVIEVNKKLAVTEHVYSTVSVIMSPQSWSKLSAENQDALQECIDAVAKSERERSRTMDKQAISDLEQKGMVVTNPDKAGFIEATQKVRDEFGGEYKDILERIQNAG